MSSSGGNVTTPLPSQRATQVVFLQLDPILQDLLSSVANYRSLVERSSCSEQELISVLQPQIDLLGRLQAAIEQLGTPFAPSLVLLADYVSLPLTTIFHIGKPTISRTPSGHGESFSASETIRLRQVRASRVRQLYQVTARCIHTYVQATSVSAEGSNPGLNVSLSNKHNVRFLIALTKGFPSDLDSAGAAAALSPSLSLDDGSDAWLAILQAIEKLIQGTSSDALAWELQGGLVARLTECATILIGSTATRAVTTPVVPLTALHVLKALLDRVVLPDQWRALFPGIFVVLYRRLVVMARTPSSSTGLVTVDVERLCLHVIGQLLRMTLQSLGQENCTSKPMSALTMLQMIQSTAAEKSKESFASSSHSPSESDTGEASSPVDFLTRIQQKVVAPLTIAVKQAMASRSSPVRLEVLQLCHILLIETVSCWKDTSMPQVALECCMILHSDSEDTVASSAKSVLQAYRNQTGEAGNASDAISSQLVSRVRSLIQELPIFAQGAKSLELRLHLQLLLGYFGMFANGRKDSSKALGSALQLFYQPLIDLMNVDSASPFQEKGIAIVADGRNFTTALAYRESKLRFKYLSLASAKLARGMLRSLGAALGVKQAAFAVDGLLSDCYEAISAEHVGGSAMNQCAGSLVVANELLLGAFNTDELATQSKPFRRRCRILRSLASSAFPLLVDDLFLGSSRPFSVTAQREQDEASITIVSLEFIASFAQLLYEDVRDFVPSVLFSILEISCSSKRHLVVQAAALDVIRTIGVASSFAVLGDFLTYKSSHLLAAMLSRLRLSGGATEPRGEDLNDTLQVMECLTWLLDHSFSTGSANGITDQSIITSVVELAVLIMKRLDHHMLDKTTIQEQDSLEVTKMYDALFRFLLSAFGGLEDSRASGHNDETKDSGHQPWLELLDVFRKPSRKGFQSEEGAYTRSDAVSEYQMPALSITTLEIDLVSKIIFRGCYLLSNQSLKVQLAACENLCLGYQFLAFVTTSEKVCKDDTSIRTSILRQVATSWPSIKARLDNVSTQITTESKTVTSLLIVHFSSNQKAEHDKRDNALDRLLLARLFALVAAICECSGEFSVDRFRTAAWPILARCFGHLMGKQRASDRIQDLSLSDELESTEENPYKIVKRKSPWSESERLLLLSIVRCIGRVFKGESGAALTRILEVAGTMILPLLGTFDDELSNAAYETIMNMLSVDCDILLRPLLHLSEQGVPSNPLREGLLIGVVLTAPDEVCISKQNKRLSKLAERCTSLLEFIEGLPEQIV